MLGASHLDPSRYGVACRWRGGLLTAATLASFTTCKGCRVGSLGSGVRGRRTGRRAGYMKRPACFESLVRVSADDAGSGLRVRFAKPHAFELVEVDADREVSFVTVTHADFVLLAGKRALRLDGSRAARLAHFFVPRHVFDGSSKSDALVSAIAELISLESSTGDWVKVFGIDGRLRTVRPASRERTGFQQRLQYRWWSRPA